MRRKNKFLGEALSAVRGAIRDSEAGLPHPASPRRFRSPTGNAVIHEISSAQKLRLGTVVGADQGPPSAYFSGAPADQSPEVLAIASRGVVKAVVRIAVCTARMWPLPRRGYRDAGRRSFYYRDCNT